MKRNIRGLHRAVILCALLLIAGTSQTLFAQESEKPEEELPKPGKVLLRSAIIPGWGQLTNKKYIKAFGFFGVHAYFTYRFFEEQEQVKLTDDPELKEDLEYQRNTWAWRYLAAYLLNLTDAYVDAHLAGFPEDTNNENVDVSFAPARRGLMMNVSISF